MKKVYTILLAAACVAGVTVAQRSLSTDYTMETPASMQPARELKTTVYTPMEMPSKSVSSLSELTQMSERGLRAMDTEMTYVTSFTATPMKAPARAAAKAPASITGNSYITNYVYSGNNMNSWFTVAEGTDGGIVLKNFAEGYDVNATYDAATGTITIPTGVVIGQFSTYGDITLYALLGNQYGVVDITGTIAEDGTISFDYGVYAAVSAGGLTVMNDVTAKAGNATFKGSLTNGTEIEAPLLIKKTAENKITVEGINAAILNYGRNLAVPMTLDETAGTAVTPFLTVFDVLTLSAGDREYYYGSIVDGYIDDLSLNVTTTEATTTLSGASTFYCYKNGTQYSGRFVNDVTVDTDFNVFTAEVPGTGDDPEPSDDNASYLTFYNDDTNDCNSYFTIIKGEGNDVVLKNFAEGFDVNATYDAAAGIITIPTGVVIGQFSSYGDVTLYALDGLQYGTMDIVGTVGEDGTITFNYGVYAAVSAGGLTVMNDLTAKPGNATFKASFKDGTQLDAPLLISKTGENMVKVVGINAAVMGYGRYLEVPMTLDETAGTVGSAFETTIYDIVNLSTGVRNYLWGSIVGGYIDDLSLNATTTETTTTLSGASTFYCYANGTQYSGMYVNNVTVDIDFNVYTAEVEVSDDDTDTPEVEGIYYKLDREAKTAAVTGCIPSLTDLNIPETITVVSGEYTVTSVAEAAFNGNKTVTSVTIPSTIVEVETDAFRNMSNVKSVNIPDLAAWCGIVFANGNANPIYNAFSASSESKWGTVYVAGEPVTTTLVVPEGVTSTSRSFYGFKSLTNVTLPSTLETLGDQTFANCTKITEVVIPEGVTTIGSAFFGCSGLTTVTLPSTLVSMTNTFYNCKALASVELPDGLETIGSMTFNNCQAITSITIPASLKSIGMMAFDGCTGLTEITSYAVVPPTAAFYAFDGVNKDIPVNVIEESMDAYKEADEWKDFTNYKAIPGLTGISSVAAEAEKAVYYDLNGARVDNPAPGIYIRKQGTTVTKVVVK